MKANKIRLLIVDDSMLFRTQIEKALLDCPEIEIVGKACDGKQAIEMMMTQEIDLCTLDIEMPVMDGMETLRMMKAKRIKTKAIMFSSYTRAGAAKTLEALELGAADFYPKPMAEENKQSLTEKIKTALLPKILAIGGRQNYTAHDNKSSFIWETFRPEILVIASSTGGPNALMEFFSQLKQPLPFPVLVAQHMPPIFTATLAENLGNACSKVSGEARHGDILRPNQIYVAPGNFHLRLSGDKISTKILLGQGELRNFVRPSADFLFESAAGIYGRNTLGVVLTGMGRDGADGAAAIKRENGAVIIQNQATSVVFGMPGAVAEAGHYDYTGSPQELAFKALSTAKLSKVGNVA